MLQAFGRATGWPLHYVAGQLTLGPHCDEEKTGTSLNCAKHPSGRGAPAQRVGNSEMSPFSPPGTAAPVAFEAARGLATALGGMLGEVLSLRRAVFEREAELAAGVPLVPNPAETEHLANRLQAVLRGGAAGRGLRRGGPLPSRRGNQQAQTKVLLGTAFGSAHGPGAPAARGRGRSGITVGTRRGAGRHSHDAALARPEEFAAAVCVPVSTSTTILGTLWMFCNERRNFTAPQTNIVEVVAGRLAADLEREMLWQEGFAAAGIKKQIAAAQRMQRNQLPSVAPLLDGWDVCGWTAQAESLGGDFHDWFCLPDGLLAVAVGHAMDGGVQAALAASALKAALRAHGQYYREAQQTLKRLNLTLWTGSAGDQRASLFYGLIETTTGRVCAAAAGRPAG